MPPLQPEGVHNFEAYLDDQVPAGVKSQYPSLGDYKRHLTSDDQESLDSSSSILPPDDVVEAEEIEEN